MGGLLPLGGGGLAGGGWSVGLVLGGCGWGWRLALGAAFGGGWELSLAGLDAALRCGASRRPPLRPRSGFDV